MDEVQEPISQSSDGADPMADRSAVLQMIRHSFGPSTLEDPFVTSDLATIVDTMVAGLRTPGYDGSSNDIFKMFGPTFGLSMTWKQHNLRKFLNTVYLFLAHRHRAYGVTCLGMPALLKNFPEFSSLDSTEQALLLAFHNYVTVAVNFLDPVNNAHIYLDMITRLTEGHEVKYIPRCGATAATRRRVGIIRAATERHVSSSKSVVASTDIGHTTVEPDLFSLIGDDKPVDRSISEMAEETRNIRDHYELLQLIREGSHGQVISPHMKK